MANAGDLPDVVENPVVFVNQVIRNEPDRGPVVGNRLFVLEHAPGGALLDPADLFADTLDEATPEAFPVRHAKNFVFERTAAAVENENQLRFEFCLRHSPGISPRGLLFSFAAPHRHDMP
ncbi:MAG: hypothetical protein BWY66_00910 [bacterium ADurb.Bin374]|nr:MAG: hypothetical protein BWY66_00910 [bacterium ADurb.Bin374]